VIRKVLTSADKGESQKITRTVEIWTYNLGPRRLVKILKFVGSKLVSIEDGGYGTAPERSLETISTADKIRLVQALQEMAEKGELVIWNPNTNQSFSGRDIEQIVLNGNAIQISLSKSNK